MLPVPSSTGSGQQPTWSSRATGGEALFRPCAILPAVLRLPRPGAALAGVQSPGALRRRSGIELRYRGHPIRRGGGPPTTLESRPSKSLARHIKFAGSTCQLLTILSAEPELNPHREPPAVLH
jgi:hypothetical protein